MEWKPVREIDELNQLLSLPSLKGSSSVGFLATATSASVLRGGLTNRLYCVKADRGTGDGEEKWVVRVSGEGCEAHFIDRHLEFKCLQVAYAANITPEPLYLAEEGLSCSRYVENAHTFDNATIKQNIPKCAAIMRHLHSLPTENYSPFVFNVFDIANHYLTVSTGHKAPLPANLPSLFETGERIRAALEASPLAALPLVPTHNDVLAANWIHGSVQGEEKLWLIDFEYAATGDRFFDLSNFSANCELGDDADRILLEAYFGSELTERHVARHKLLRAASDLREGMWSFVQWGISNTCEPAFYAEYGNKCLQRFEGLTKNSEFEEWLKHC